MNELSDRVIRQDHRLEKEQDRTQEELARHRWHWTLDESNPKRVPIRAYAKAVGRGHPRVLGMVNGYMAWQNAGGPSGGTSLTECIDRAKVGAEQEAAIDAVAAATGSTFTGARHRHEDVRTVRNMAEERAQRRGSTVDAELAGAAADLVRTRAADKQRQHDRAQRHGVRYMELEGQIAAAMRSLREALDTSEGVEFSDEERRLIGEAIGNLRAVLNLIDARVTGGVDVDWDAEMRRLGAS